jgi:hypothetical protein
MFNEEMNQYKLSDVYTMTPSAPICSHDNLLTFNAVTDGADEADALKTFLEQYIGCPTKQIFLNRTTLFSGHQ